MAHPIRSNTRGAMLALLITAALLTMTSAGVMARAEQTTRVQEKKMQIQYLEIVTPELEATCAALAAVHGVEFGDPIPELGNARTAALSDGGMIGVRGPMRDTETPVVRPYVLVDDIDSAVKSAESKGAEIAIGPMPIPGQGKFAIYILGGIEHGVWEK